MLCKQAEGLERIQRIAANFKLEKSFRVVLDFTIDLADKEYALESKQAHRNSFIKRADRNILFHRWVQAYQFKQKFDLLNLKASRFHALNTQIKSKMIFQKLRKIVKRDRVGARDLYLNFQKKYYLHEYFCALRYHPSQLRQHQLLAKKCLVQIRATLEQERQEIKDFCSRKLAYKVLYVFKRNRREQIEKRIYNKVAQKFLTFKLKFKVLKSLGLRVDRNQLLRKDLVKRYWIHNSDDEDEVASDQAAVPQVLNSEGPVE